MHKTRIIDIIERMMSEGDNRHSREDVSPEDFVIKAIERLRTPPYKGIHSVFSGFNEAFRSYYPLIDPVMFIQKLAKEGKVVIRPAKKGVLLYKLGDASNTLEAEEIIKKIVD